KSAGSSLSGPYRLLLLLFLSESLDLYIHTGGQIELHQSIYGLLCRLENVEKTLMRPNFELFARFFVYVRRAQNRVAILQGRQWNRPGNCSAGTLCRVDNVARRLVEDTVIVGLQSDANSFFHFLIFLFYPLSEARGLLEERALCRKV